MLSIRKKNDNSQTKEVIMIERNRRLLESSFFLPLPAKKKSLKAAKPPFQQRECQLGLGVFLKIVSRRLVLLSHNKRKSMEQFN